MTQKTQTTNRPYFVMLNNQRGGASAMTCNKFGDVAFFSNVDEAKELAGNNILGKSFGFQIYSLEEGAVYER